MNAPLKLDELKSLHEKKFRDERGLFLAEGEHLVLELENAVSRHPALGAAQVYVSHEYAAEHAMGDRWRGLGVHRLASRQIAAVSDTRNPQGVLAVVPMPPVSPLQADERTIYLHGIQDPGNLGTILRTLAWFGGFRCLLSPQSVDPYNPKVVRASMGAIFHVPIECEVTVEQLLARHPTIALLDVQGEPLSNPDFRDFGVYAFGSESRGLPKDLLVSAGIHRLSIPGGRGIDSLNLASAVNICAYELSRR